MIESFFKNLVLFFSLRRNEDRDSNLPPEIILQYHLFCAQPCDIIYFQYMSAEQWYWRQLGRIYLSWRKYIEVGKIWRFGFLLSMRGFVEEF